MFDSAAALQVSGLAIVGLALAQAGAGLAATLLRRLRQARFDRRDARLFEERARAQLQAAEAAREKQELSWTGLRKFTIARKVPEAEGVCSFYLEPHDGKPLPPFEPGQYLTFQLHIPGQTKHVVRCYSLSDSPYRRDHYRVTIKKLPPPRDTPEAPPGLSSAFFHDQLQEGDTVDVRAPNGHFYLDRTRETPVVLIAGGVGLTPMVAMLNAICDSGSEREVWFFYGVRHGGEHAMKDHLAELDRAYPHVHVVTFYSAPREGDVQGRDFTYEGHVGVDAMRALLGSTNYDFYLCGPPPMMQLVTEGLEAWGVPEKAINYEAFGPATVKKSPQSEAAQEAAAEGVEVTFARSGKSCTWDHAAGALLDLAEANGVDMDSGCRGGNCGTCLTAIKEGEVAYLSEPGVPPEAGSCLTCIAVPKGRLVLDA